MKVFPLSFIGLSPRINLCVSPLPVSDALEVGQTVIWLYKVRTDATTAHKIPAEIVKLGSKQVQIKFRTKNNQWVNRWVNRNRLETIPVLSPPNSEI